METGGRRVLVVDDDPDIREALGELLKVDGYRPICVGNGQEALDALDVGPRPGLVLLDMMMPVLDGYGFLAGLKSREAPGTLPVLVLSAHASGPQVAGDAGVTGFLRKPFSTKRLMRMVDQHCLPA